MFIERLTLVRVIVWIPQKKITIPVIYQLSFFLPHNFTNHILLCRQNIYWPNPFMLK